MINTHNFICELKKNRKKISKVSENCPKGIKKTKIYLFKKIYHISVMTSEFVVVFEP
jgi:hypothetical protein